MIAPIARQDYEEMIERGLPATLDDFDRLNSVALRLTNGKETTAANFPRVGWAGDVPFYQPTCAAFAWWMERVERADFETPLENLCWFYALNHGRTPGAFDALVTPDEIRKAVEAWAATVYATAEELSRACLYAARGFDDAVAGKTPAQEREDAKKTHDEMREESAANLAERVTKASALTGIEAAKLMLETPSRLDRMIEEVEKVHGAKAGSDEDRLRRDYDMTRREILKRLIAEKEAAEDGK